MPSVFCMASHSEACKNDPTWCLPSLTFSAHRLLFIGFRWMLINRWEIFIGSLLRVAKALWGAVHFMTCNQSFISNIPVPVTIWTVCIDGLIYSESKARGCLFSLASPKESWFLIDWISIWCRWISHHWIHGLVAIFLRFSSSQDNSSSKIRGSSASVVSTARRIALF